MARVKGRHDRLGLEEGPWRARGHEDSFQNLMSCESVCDVLSRGGVRRQEEQRKVRQRVKAKHMVSRDAANAPHVGPR